MIVGHTILVSGCLPLYAFCISSMCRKHILEKSRKGCSALSRFALFYLENPLTMFVCCLPGGKRLVLRVMC